MNTQKSQEAVLLKEIADLAALINKNKHGPPYPHPQSFYNAPQTTKRFANMTLSKPSSTYGNNEKPPSTPIHPHTPTMQPPTLPKPAFHNKSLNLKYTNQPSTSKPPIPKSSPSTVKSSYVRRGNKLVRKSTAFYSKGATPQNLKHIMYSISNTYSPSLYIKQRMLQRASRTPKQSPLSRRLSLIKRSRVISPMRPTQGSTYVRRGGNKLVRNSLKYIRPSTPKKPPQEPVTPKGKKLTIAGQTYVKTPQGRSLVRSKNLSARVAASNRIKRTLQNVRKKQYCLFYNKFGKCNNSDCKYVHDPDKVAVCRIFLKGKCEDANCLLQHKIDADRMPVCWHFLRGICTNDNCPYSHVYVNPQADVCPDFAKGYCPYGKACKLKHVSTKKPKKDKVPVSPVLLAESTGSPTIAGKKRKLDDEDELYSIRPRLNKQGVLQDNSLFKDVDEDHSD